MKRTAIGLVVALASMSALLAQGLTPPPLPPPGLTEEKVLVPGQNIVIVSGTASVTMTPDLVSMNLGVLTKAQTPRKAVDDNSTNAAKIIANLKSRGVKPEQIQTFGFALRPTEKDGVRTGYEVTNTIGVSTKAVSDVGEMIDAAVNSGANEIYGPQFSVENEKHVQDTCITSAFADAKAKARKLAELSERSLGRVLAVTDGSSSPFELKSRSGVEGGVAGGVSIEPGVHTVDCGVTIAFELK